MLHPVCTPPRSGRGRYFLNVHFNSLFLPLTLSTKRNGPRPTGTSHRGLGRRARGAFTAHTGAFGFRCVDSSLPAACYCTRSSVLGRRSEVAWERSRAPRQARLTWTRGPEQSRRRGRHPRLPRWRSRRQRPRHQPCPTLHQLARILREERWPPLWAASCPR